MNFFRGDGCFSLEFFWLYLFLHKAKSYLLPLGLLQIVLEGVLVERNNVSCCAMTQVATTDTCNRIATTVRVGPLHVTTNDGKSIFIPDRQPFPCP